MEGRPDMKKNTMFLSAAVAVIVFVFAVNAQDTEYHDAINYITKVFNDSYVILSNNAKVSTSFEIKDCSISYSMNIQGMIERQSCSIKDLDPKRIDGDSGMINIWTVNEERKVKVSSLPKKYWALSLSYNSDKYPEKTVIHNLEMIITGCK
jgi:hypothetical protein